MQALVLRRQARKRVFRIFHSVDGTKPSLEYAGPFSVKPGTRVRACIFSGTKVLLELSEKFGPSEGIYWPNETDVAEDLLEALCIEMKELTPVTYRVTFCL